MTVSPIPTLGTRVSLSDSKFIDPLFLDNHRQRIGRVESIMTRHAAEGDFHFVSLVLADGSLWRGKWRAVSGEALPNLGEHLRVEFVGGDHQEPMNPPPATP